MAVELRPVQTLHLWHDINLALVRDDEPDLSARQVTILLTVYLEPQPHTIRGLAAKLGVTKPVITRALDSMGRLGLLARKRDPDDGRNVLIQRTVDGSLYVERLADLIIVHAAQMPA
ncbi:MAG: MarR family winged helix-turn-helix transcriptional regulator [Alphaproteobacteria bacterium]